MERLEPQAAEPVERDRLLTAEDVARHLRVPVSWVREKTRLGELPHVRLGRYCRYALPQINAYIASLGHPGGGR